MTMYDILHSTPVHDTVVVRFERPEPGHIDEIQFTEEQVRWLQVNIAKGNYPYNKVWIIREDGHKVCFKPDGRLEEPCGNNCLSLNDDLAMMLLKVVAGIE